MSLSRLIRSALVLGAAALAGTASAVAAQDRNDRELFAWSGSVDREVLITMQGRDAWAEGLGDLDRDEGRAQVYATLPRQEGWITVRVVDGRGDVDVVQQPSARNDYTAVVRVRDPSSGADRYTIHAYWRFAADRADIIGGDRDRPGQATGRTRGPGRIGDYDRDRWYDRDPWGDDRDDDDARRRDRFARTALRWSGNVDGTLEIRIQGNRLWYRELSGREVRGVRVQRERALPRGNVRVGVDELAGRGSVRVVQQPSARNGFTTVLQVRDPQSGYGRYVFELLWRPNGNARGY